MGDYIAIGIIVFIIIIYIFNQGGLRKTPKNIDLYEYNKDNHSGKYTPKEMRERVYSGYYTKKDR